MENQDKGTTNKTYEESTNNTDRITKYSMIKRCQ